MNKKLTLLIAVLFMTGTGYAQDLPEKIQIPPVGLKTNLLYDVTTTFNLGIELRTSNKTSLDISGNWNPWTFSGNRKWKHILIQPEFRLWTKETFSGHFFGFHAHYAYYNAGNLPEWLFARNMQNSRYKGWFAGAGAGYGYRWKLNRHWGLETEIGVGYVYLDYSKYECAKCGEKLGNGTRNYFGPTKAAISLVYNFGRKKTVSAHIPVYIPQVVVKEVDPPTTPRYAVSYITPETETIKMRSQEGKAYLDFAAGKSDIVSSYGNNASELRKIHELIKEVKNDPDATMTGITIRGYASPEDTYHFNLTLSQRRANALKTHIQSVYSFPNNFFLVEGKGEDWATLDSMVSKSFMADKFHILEIIRGTDVFDGREKKLMTLAEGNPYRKMLKEMFPLLRRSEYSLHYSVAPFTVEKGKEIFKTKPSSLSLHEMFLIANSYTPGSKAFNELFETAARIFTHDDIANLNAASAALERDERILAERYLNSVSEQGRKAAWYNNMGVLNSLKGEFDKALDFLDRAASMGDGQAAQNRIILTQYKGEMEKYEQATKPKQF